MKFSASQADRFVRAPDPNIRAVLVYGPDAGLVRERAEAIARAVAPELSDPFRVTNLSARQLVDDTVDSLLIRVSAYTLLLIALLALALVAVAWFVYARYLAPIARLFAPLAAAPEQFAELSRRLENSSASLLELKRIETRAGRRDRRNSRPN